MELAHAPGRSLRMQSFGGTRESDLVQLRLQATDVLRSLVRRSQRNSGSWSAAERQRLAELSASLRDNLELLPLHHDAPANAVTKARARAVIDLVADIGALCQGRTDILEEASETTVRLPSPPPLDFRLRTGVIPGAPLAPPPSPAAASARPHLAFADRAHSLIQLAAREGWAEDEEQRLQSLVASLCETTRLLAHSHDCDGRDPPNAVARARGRAIATMLDEVAEMFQRSTGTAGGSQTTRAVDLLRSQASRLMGADTKPARDPLDSQNSNSATRREGLVAKHSTVTDTTAARVKTVEAQDTTAEAAAAANAVRRMSRRHKLAVLRAWRRHVDKLRDEKVHAQVHAESEALRQQNAALMQQLRTLETGERDSLARAQAAVSTAESLAEANSAFEVSLQKAQTEIRAAVSNAESLAEAKSAFEVSLQQAQAETEAANTAQASALTSLAEAEERAEQAQRKIVELQQHALAAQKAATASEAASVVAAKSTVEAEMGSKLRELDSQLIGERLAGAAKCDQLESIVAELQRQMEELQSKSRDEAIAAGNAAEELTAKAVAAEERLLAAQQLACQQSDEYRRKLDSMQHETEQQVDAHRATELSVQQHAARWQEQAESAVRELEQQCAQTREAHKVIDEERTRRLAAEQSLTVNHAQFNRIASTVREAEEAVHQIADARHAVLLSANDLKDAAASTSDSMSAAAERAAMCLSAVADVHELRIKLQQHLHLEQAKPRALKSQQADMLATNKALVAEMRELKLQVTSEAAVAAELTRELRRRTEHVEALQTTVSELEEQACAADNRAQLAETEADRMVERIASLAEMKIRESERQVEVARERARVQVEEAERLVLAISDEVEQLSAQDLTLGDRDLE